MALRDFVTGSDACTPGDGAGPSNAAGALANTLLGRGSKQQERLRELPGVHGPSGPGPSVYAAPRAPTVADIARAAAEGDMVAIPGLAGPSAASQADVDAFLRGQPSQKHQRHFLPAPGLQQQRPPAGDASFAGFEEAYREGLRRPPTPFPHGVIAGDRSQLRPFLQAFVESGRLGSDFRPLPAGGVALSVPDQCRVRDRSTIMARHLYADMGDAFADAQARLPSASFPLDRAVPKEIVGKLLQSLNIDAASLPAVLPGRGSWDDIFRQGGRDPMASMEVAAAARAAAQQRPHDRWAAEFAGMSLQDHPQHVSGGEAWGAEFARQQPQRPPGPAGWADEFQQQQQQPGGEWAAEFRSQQATATKAASATDSAGASLAQTKALAETLAADPDPKVQNSKFLHFLSKMSRGELYIDDNQVKERPAAATGAAWADEYAAHQRHNPQQQAAGSQWADEFDGNPGQRWLGDSAAEQRNDDVSRWADDFATEMSSDQTTWAEQYNAGAEDWLNEYGREMGDAAAAEQMHMPPPRTRQQGYVFAAENPFRDDLESFAKGKELFRRGVLSEAVLALEAEVQRSPRSVEAWRLLGTVHAENDDDTQAIAAMDRALEADPGNLEVLLSLGVSHTNELDAAEALSYLHRWITAHPTHGPAAAAAPGPPDSSQRHAYVVGLFEAAARAAPGDADAHVALGVLHNLGRAYEPAVAAFRAALALRPQDYSLWNKLGATLANSAHSGEAIAAYQRALEAKPNYMRAWTNMGISQANVGQYDASARYYVRALGLNPRASNVWGYLRTSLSCAGRMDLLPAVEDQDLAKLQSELPL